MKILYIAYDDPSKVGCGTQQRTHFLHEALKPLGEVTVFNPAKKRQWTWIERVFVALTKEGEWPFRSEKEVRRELGIGNAQFDLVVTRYARLAARYSAWKIAPLIVDVDNLPLQAFRSIGIRRIPCGLKGFCTWLVRAWQRFVFRRCKAVWVVKEADAEALPKRLPYAVLPNLAIAPPAGFHYIGRQERLMMTVGFMGYGPNAEGVDWFVENIWRPFQKKHLDWKYAIAGKALSQDCYLRWTNVPGMQVLGFVEDLESLYARSTIVVAPILSGSGTCIKVLESALRGRKVLATEFALRGLCPVDRKMLGMGSFSNVKEFELEVGNWMMLSDDERAVNAQRMCAYAAKLNSRDRYLTIVESIAYKVLDG